MTADDIREIEEVSLNALPALREVLYDGWVVRFANGYTRRSNSVTPLNVGRIDVWEKIRFCEQLYHLQRLPPIFKLTVASQPPGLDAALAGCGFHCVPGAIVNIAELDRLEASPDSRAIDAPLERWTKSLVQAKYIPPKHESTLRAIVNAIALPRMTALFRHNDRDVATGLAVLQGSWVGLFDISTDPSLRRQGLATAMIGHLLHWARERGARRAYLQVAPDNAAARELYAKIGFRHAYEYEYWQRAV